MKRKTDIEQLVYLELLKHFEEGKDFCYDYSPYCKYNYRIDFAFPDLRIGVETDGSHWHTDKEHDRRRDCYFRERGWLIIRFTDNEIHSGIESVTDKIMGVYNGRKNSKSKN